MLIELESIKLKAEPEKPLKVYYEKHVVGNFYIDLLWHILRITL